MEQLNTKIKSLKSVMTKAMNKLEKDITAFEKLEGEQALAAKVRRKAIEVTETREKLKNGKKDMEKATDSLREVYYKCKKEELKEDKEQAIEKVDANIDKYLERYEALVEDNDDTL